MCKHTYGSFMSNEGDNTNSVLFKLLNFKIFDSISLLLSDNVSVLNVKNLKDGHDDHPDRIKQTLPEENSCLGFQKGVMGAPVCQLLQADSNAETSCSY